ncbi:hypothetical protein JOD64_003416 [Micromonospora luteifusca]|uniref:Uncharacterized protein n=1 Tax=Micromonospora luteifusca TaxID=709860 RepID=A0ABS2LVI2_9ACTN|nr:hypothetical protein [Micromonospora luteifusca]MBM7492194.1 hypothetical protein [Micromonospora luteifusca]
MSSAAPARPARWAVLRSLRELTRLAITALVLAVGLGGALAATAPPAPTQLRPSAVSSRVATVGPDATVRPDAAPDTERAGQPVAARSAGRVDTAGVTGPIAEGPGHAAAIDPGRGVPARRGPPTR